MVSEPPGENSAAGSQAVIDRPVCRNQGVKYAVDGSADTRHTMDFPLKK